MNDAHFSYTDILSFHNEEQDDIVIPDGWVKLYKDSHGRTRQEHGRIDPVKNTCTPYNSITLLERNIEHSVECLKNRYYHPYQLSYEDSFHYTSDSESDNEEEEYNE
jgi:hypothetical protein